MTNSKLRPMIEADLELVLQWRNHPDIRQHMYTTEEISMSNHRKWFARTLNNPDVDLLVFECDGQRLGVVNVTRTRSRQVADWGFYMAPDAPKGHGRSLGAAALEHAFNRLQLHKLCGQALGFNERSIRFHKRLGFTEEGRLREHHFDGKEFQDVVCFGLLNREWQAQFKGRHHE